MITVFVTVKENLLNGSLLEKSLLILVFTGTRKVLGNICSMIDYHIQNLLRSHYIKGTAAIFARCKCEHVAKRDVCLIVVQHDGLLTFAYYNCESKIFKLSLVPLTRTRRCSLVAQAQRGRAAPVHRPDNKTPRHRTRRPPRVRQN